MATNVPADLIASIRRSIGDTDPENYVFSTKDLYFFLQDAIDEVQADYNYGYLMTVTDTSATFNTTLWSTPFVLFKLRTLMLILQHSLHDFIYDAGNIQVGDIKVDLTQVFKLRMMNLDRVKKDYEKMMYHIKLNGAGGLKIDTHVTGLISNVVNTDYLTFELN